MSWSVGYDSNWDRDIGYGVPAVCDHPNCGVEINRGLSYVCGDEPYGGEHGCGLFFCSAHLLLSVIAGSDSHQLCDRCVEGDVPYKPKPDVRKWILHKLNDPSWSEWRHENMDWVRQHEHLRINQQ